MGAVEPGIIALTLGTSGVVFATTGGPFIEPEGRLHAFCHSVPGRWHLMGVMLSAAGSLQWYRDALAPSLDFDALLGEAAAVAAGADGLVFLPYLTGERTPHPDPLARGAFVGLTRRHARGHLTRAVLEGVTFGMRDAIEIMQEMGIAATQVRASGGGAKSGFWRQLQADIYRQTIVLTNSSEGPAYGVALLAGVGTGCFRSVEEACRSAIKETTRIRPNKKAMALYDRHYAIYRKLYGDLKQRFGEMAALV